MPQQPGGKSKKKGRAPAHQNTYAFKHNPNSKKTAKILAMPVEGLCRRCTEKIEWRKKYRKYKPLTQPSKCNRCHKRNIKAAYHTICVDCASKDNKICEMCTKEPALRNEYDEQEQEIERQRLLLTMSKMKLREKRTLERQLERHAAEEYGNQSDEDISVQSGAEESKSTDDDDEGNGFE
mmetsp:Transcript_6551/g.8605  ORF Transcript_6551/g.8605 Transcript_6551/m.8605 type:complete len:180 (-) Transcript_6551:79-618(-)